MTKPITHRILSRARAAVALLPALAMALALVAGCAYKIEIKQGSERLLRDFERVEVGMTREEVRAILGPPTAPRMFRKNVWIYVFQRRAAGFVGGIKARSVELTFDDAGVLREINIARDDYAEEATADGEGSDDGGGS